MIQTESRIGAIYLCECEYLNAAEHLREVRKKLNFFNSIEFQIASSALHYKNSSMVQKILEQVKHEMHWRF